MSSKSNRYDEDFKKSLVAFYHNGKTQFSLCQEYGVSATLNWWIKQLHIVEPEGGKIMTVRQVKDFQERLAQNEKEIFRESHPNEMEVN